MTSTRFDSDRVCYCFQQHRPARSESNASFLSYLNNKRRTSTILMPALPHSKSSHYQNPKEKHRYLLVNGDHRLVQENPPPSAASHSHHRKQVEAMRRELTQALHNIRYIAAHCANESLIESIRDEWKFIASVIDRLQFLLFLLVTFFGSLALLYQVSIFIVWMDTRKCFDQSSFRFQVFSNSVQQILKN